MLDRAVVGHNPAFLTKKARCGGQPSGGFQGTASDILIHAQETEKLKRRLNEIYVKHTGRTLDEVEQALERDRFMSPDEAKDWGLIDDILGARGKAVPES